ncbi:hypothetical protein ABZ904_18130 [Streptomyces sp. NPDC046900]|uniref:hypothetical protein n=1 Tax=Streptomyces sp. NPDC046900 TaxID=3155473 RepID=UPI0033F02410
MLSHFSDRGVSGRTDLQESAERVSGHHLNEIRQRLLVDPKSLNEAHVAWALEVHPFLSGTRGIARWTHQHKETVQEMAAKEGGVSRHQLLYTARRGTSSISSEEREDMVLRFNSLAGRSWTPLGATGYRSFAAQYLSKTNIPSGPWTERILEDKNPQRGNGRETTGIADELVNDLVNAHEDFEKLTDWGSPRSWSHTLMTILDPSNDVWAEEGNDALGKHAWRLAVLFGVRDIFVTQTDLMALTGLAERPVRRLLDRWKKGSMRLAVEAKVGRTKVYTLLFHSVLDPDGMMFCGHLGDKTKLNAAMAKDAKERATAARRGTPEGAIAWKAANPRTRQAFLDDLPRDADQVWRELVERGDEMEMYEHLVAQAKEAGSVPSTPEALVEKAAVARPAQESLGTQRFMALSEQDQQETLAAMRRRVSGIGSA